MKRLYFLSILLVSIFILKSCKSCDEDHCEGRTFDQIKLVFNLDSLNGQFNSADLDSIEIQETGFYQTKYFKPDKTGQFTLVTGYGEIEYYNIFIIDKNNVKVNVLNGFEYFQENPDCACRENRVIKSFNFNGKKVKLPAPGSAPYIVSINKK